MPAEPGCAGLGAMSVTRPSLSVARAPQQVLHSQQVVATVLPGFSVMSVTLAADAARAAKIGNGA